MPMCGNSQPPGGGDIAILVVHPWRNPETAGGAQGAALRLVHQCQAEMHPLVALALRAPGIQHVGVVDPAARGLAP